MARRGAIIAAFGVGGGLLALGGWAIASGIRRAGLEGLAEDVARHHGVPVPVFLAMIYAESNWNPRAQNCRGSDGAQGCAWGLLQMIPGTAEGVGLVGPPQQMLDDPGLALDLGGKLMARMQREWGGPSDDAMRYRVGWAWGSGAAKHWPPASPEVQGWILQQEKYRKGLRRYGWPGRAWPYDMA